MDDEQLESRELFICRECETYTATSSSILNNHIEKKHIGTRTQTNFELLSEILYYDIKNVKNNNWEEGLKWLRDFEPSEPTFRQSLITKIKWELQDDVTDCFEDIIQLCVESNKIAKKEDDCGSIGYNSEHIWKLPFIFE